MRLGILGGTFDPPHNGHLAIANAALTQLELDELLFVPTHQNPLKERRLISKPKQRMEMTELLVENNDKFAITDIELSRGGPSYALETMEELSMVQPAEYWFLMGSDSLKTFPNWKGPDRILRICRLGVLARPGINKDHVLAELRPEWIEKIDWIDAPELEVSSTDIRDRVLKNLPVSHMMPAKVLQYVQKHKLYKL